MHFYEINILISPNLSQEEAVTFVANLQNQFQDLGKIISETKAERKKLAYDIEKQEEAWLSYFNLFPNENKDLKEALDLIEKTLKQDANILRHLIVRKDEKKIEKKRTITKASPEKPVEHPIRTEVELKEVEDKINELLEE
ncbi:MAG TPA: 30S ribosomal protein S6 [Candidatus Pacearchaeota archaeon]|nr:30S ribosomal protein S6 [Candidatus Pacearchaeota archaeon]HOC53560.1 30S ribosomal protein S6 [Candidatus Pacearchaeota archaeon]HQM24477.1 30S ribosomal protein S6 [Candidatus Pacearchaeota archaeon]